MPEPSTFKGLVEQAVRYLEKNQHCSKHHVKHTGKNAYLLDFYSFLGDIGKGVRYVHELVGMIVSDGNAYVFYPGNFNPMKIGRAHV